MSPSRKAAAKKMSGQLNALHKRINTLRSERLRCERSGKVEEAERVNNTLVQILDDIRRKNRHALLKSQESALLSVDEAHEVEKEKFETVWKQKLDEFDKRAQRIVDETQARQAQEFLDWRNNISGSLYKPIIYSEELKDLRCIQQSLICQHEYREAVEIKRRADEIEEKELEINRQRNKDIFTRKDLEFKKKLKAELAVILKRLRADRKKLEQKCELDRSKVEQRYRNIKEDLNLSHNLELIKMDRENRLPRMYSH